MGSLDAVRRAFANLVWCGAVPGREGCAFCLLAKPSDESSPGISLLPLRSVISLLVRGDSRSQMHSPCLILAGELQSGTGPDCNHFATSVVGVGVRGLGLGVTHVWPLLVDFGGSLDAVSANRHCDWLDTAAWVDAEMQR